METKKPVPSLEDLSLPLAATGARHELAQFVQMRRTLLNHEPIDESNQDRVDRSPQAAQAAAVSYQAALHVSSEREKRLSQQKDSLIQEIQAVAIELDREHDRTHELEVKLEHYKSEISKRENAFRGELQRMARQHDTVLAEMSALKADVAVRESKALHQNNSLAQNIRALTVELEHERKRCRDLEVTLGRHRGEISKKENTYLAQIQQKSGENETLTAQMAALRADIQVRETQMFHRLNSLREIERTDKEKLTLALAKRDYELKGTRAALAHTQIQSEARAEALKRAQDAIVTAKAAQAVQAQKSVKTPVLENSRSSAHSSSAFPSTSTESARERLERRLANLPPNSPECANLQEIIATMAQIEIQGS